MTCWSKPSWSRKAILASMSSTDERRLSRVLPGLVIIGAGATWVGLKVAATAQWATNGQPLDGKADGYDSPDDVGVNQEYWLEMTLAVDTSIRFLVADSDNAPLAGGDYYHGIFLFLDGQLRPIGNINE